MALQNYREINAQLIQGGAPVDFYLLDSLRQNDVLFESWLRALICTPLAPHGSDGPLTNPAAHRFVNATTITVSADVTLAGQVPLVWIARERIQLSAKIVADGKGAPLGQKGDFGGSGGGGGQACQIPVTGREIHPGGAANGNALDPVWAERVFGSLGVSRGGAAGGGAAGGAGGGIVVLCAPVIELLAGGQITAKGADGGAASGGGGGGLIVLIARQVIGAHLTTGASGAQNIFVAGGAGPAGSGGQGLFLQKIVR